MQIVDITTNARLKKDDDQNFWLLIESRVGPASFNLTAFTADRVTYEVDAGFQKTLEAFMAEQQRAGRSRN